MTNVNRKISKIVDSRICSAPKNKQTRSNMANINWKARNWMNVACPVFLYANKMEDITVCIHIKHTIRKNNICAFFSLNTHWKHGAHKNPEKNNLFKFFKNINFRCSYILILRSFPILRHVLGCYIIASSGVKKKIIIINTFMGSFFYYIFLFLIIGNV